jgi:hypothetical protein
MNEFRTFAADWTAYLIAAVTGVAAGTLVIEYPHALLIFKTGPWLYAFGILAAFAVYGATDVLIGSVRARAAAVRDLRTAERNLAAVPMGNPGSRETSEFLTANRAVADAEQNPWLPRRYLDSRDRIGFEGDDQW